MGINLNLKKAEKVIDAADLENLFALGLQRKEVAKKLDVSIATLTRKIGNSQTLTEARKRGKERFKSSQSAQIQEVPFIL